MLVLKTTLTNEEFYDIFKDFDATMKRFGYVKVKDVSNKFYVSIQTIDSWVRNGKIKYPDVVKVGRGYYFKETITYPERKTRKANGRRKETA